MRIKLSVPLYLSEISIAVNGCGVSEDHLIEYISTDTRELNLGDLFIAIKGERYDGLNFISEAKEIGAYTLGESDEATIFTENFYCAILKLISLYKSRLSSLKHTILITGSVGKTSTKELLYSLIKSCWKAHATYKNYNNIYGVMHTVLSAKIDTEVLICEVGMNKEGEIAPISKALSPDIAIITNIGTAHIGELGSRENIARAKLEACEGIDRGITIIPANEPLLKNAKNKHTVALTPGADTLLIPLSLTDEGSYFDFYSGGIFLKNQFLKIPGEHILNSLSLALAAAIKIKTPINNLKEALKSIGKGILRQQMININGLLIYDDTYSSSYEALIATVKMLKLYKKEISVVLSDILELGEYSDEVHNKCGAELARLGVKRLFLCGNNSDKYKDGAISGGMKEENIHINNIDESYISLKEEIIKYYSGEILLIKGSHKTNLSRLIDTFKEKED